MKAQHIPNALCVLRIVLVVPLVYCIMQGRFEFAFLLFGVAGFTDALDGYLARRYGWNTPLGGILDPIADKTLVIAVFLALVLSTLVPIWFAALIIVRDLIIMAGGLLYRLLIGAYDGGATGVGKLNTALLLLYVLLLLANAAFAVPTPPVLIALGGIVVASTVVSGLDYVRTWGRQAWQNRGGAAQ